nr:hypothetical protein [uncultured bacterium]
MWDFEFEGLGFAAIQGAFVFLVEVDEAFGDGFDALGELVQREAEDWDSHVVDKVVALFFCFGFPFFLGELFKFGFELRVLCAVFFVGVFEAFHGALFVLLGAGGRVEVGGGDRAAVVTGQGGLHDAAGLDAGGAIEEDQVLQRIDDGELVRVEALQHALDVGFGEALFGVVGVDFEFEKDVGAGRVFFGEGGAGMVLRFGNCGLGVGRHRGNPLCR